MSITIRKALDRGNGAFGGWLKSLLVIRVKVLTLFEIVILLVLQITTMRFSGFGPLRVLNEDFVSPNSGFDTHSHSNYEIFSYVLSGELTHKDTMGNDQVMRRGDIQFTSAGTGISHSEYNRNKFEPCLMIGKIVNATQQTLSFFANLD